LDDLKLLITTHGPTVWRTVFRLLNHHDDAQDCYQETFLAAWKIEQDPNHDEVGSWPALLKTVATRKAIDRLRQRYKQRSHTPPAGGEETLPPHRGAGVGANLDAAELRERVRQALAEVPERQAEAFWLRHVEQMSRREAADHLGVEPANVSVLVNRAAAKLRPLLDDPDAPHRTISMTFDGGLA